MENERKRWRKREGGGGKDVPGLCVARRRVGQRRLRAVGWMESGSVAIRERGRKKGVSGDPQCIARIKKGGGLLTALVGAPTIHDRDGENEAGRGRK